MQPLDVEGNHGQGSCNTRNSFESFEEITTKPSMSIFPETVDEISHARSSPISVQGSIPEEAQESVERKLVRGRVYYLDWMRIVSIYLVVSYHVIQALDWIGLWCGEQKRQDISFRCVALQLGMPMFFHVSGRAQGLVRIKSLRVAVSTRFLRLFVPFIVFWIILIPPWLYISDKENMLVCMKNFNSEYYVRTGDDYFTKYWPTKNFPQDIFSYLIAFWTFQKGVFKFDPAWLWFLPVLYMVTMTTLPVMMYGEKRNPLYLSGTLALLILQTLLIVNLEGYRWPFILFMALEQLGTAAIVHVVPFPDINSDPKDLAYSANRRYIAIRCCTALNVIATVGCVSNLHYKEMESDVLKTVPQMFMYPIFYLHGFFVQRWWPEKTPSKIYHRSLEGRVQFYSKAFEIGIIMFILLCIFAGSPVGNWETANWPIYSMTFRSESIFAQAYVMGTWAWLSIADMLFQANAEDVMHETFHHHASASTIVVYIFHWMFIKIYCWYIIRDWGLMQGFWKYFAVVSTFLVGVVPSLGIYYLFTKNKTLGMLVGI